MNEERVQLTIGQRVRINEEEDPAPHIGKMATVERVELPAEGEPICQVRIDRSGELIALPQRYLESVVTKPSSLLANDLSMPWDPQPNSRFKMFTKDNWLAARILETLLFYHQVVVPTTDFSIVVPFVHWLGVPLFKELLEAHAISFVRMSGSLAYIGNGVGLAMYEIRPGEETKKAEPWWIKASRCSPQEAVTLQLQNRLSGLKEGLIDLLARFVELHTVDTALPQFKEKVAHETYRDIQGSKVVIDHFFIRNPSIGYIELNRLPGIEPNQARVFTLLPKPAVAADEIDITLRLAMLNLEAYMAEEAGARDIVTDHGFERILAAKVQRYTGGNVAQESFSQLVRIEGIPDIVTAIMSGEVSLSRIWQYRNTRTADQFRDWFDQVGPANPEKVVSEYVKSLRSGGLWSSKKPKILRFIVLQAIGAGLAHLTSGYSLIVTMSLSAVDSFLLDKIRLGFKPRYYIDELRNLFPQ
jgi:hypothetical protein